METTMMYTSCPSTLILSFIYINSFFKTFSEIVDLIKYPLALNGLVYGVYRSLDRFTNDDLENHRKDIVDKPRYIYICLFTVYKNENTNCTVRPAIAVTRNNISHLFCCKKTNKTISTNFSE